MVAKRVLTWLMDPVQPSVRLLTLTQLLGRPGSDPEVVAAREQLPRVGWVREQLDQRAPKGGWDTGPGQYTPKYLSTNWRMLLLAELGATEDIPEVREACEYWMDGFPLEGGGVGGNSKGAGHHCVVGNMARALILMGYGDDPRVRRSMEWLADTASPLGGWSCWGTGRNLDSWEGLSAFAVYPRSRWTGAMRDCAERGAEFFLARELHHQGEPYPPWYRFHDPVHYYYDVLVGLEVLTGLGHGADPRLRFALDLLQKKRRPDGLWNLDAVHPDVEGPVARFYAAHPKRRPTPLALEVPGKPSKMVTLRALRVMAQVERARPSKGDRPRGKSPGGPPLRVEPD